MKKAIKKTTVKKYQAGGKVGSGAAKKAVSNAKTNAEMKKLENQGKPNSRTEDGKKGVEYNSKGAVENKYNVGSKTGTRNVYSNAAGEAERLTYNIPAGKVTRERMDTTGFSGGKKAFTKKTTTQSKSGEPLQRSSKKVDRKDVPKELKKMQTFRKGGTKKPLKKAQDGGSNLKEFRKRSFRYDGYGYNPELRDYTVKQFGADKKGKLSTTTTSYKQGVTVGGNEIMYFPSRRTTLDTTGYSKGKQEFPAKVGVNEGQMPIGYHNPYSETTVNVPRKDVPKVIANMKKGTGPDLVKKNTANKAKVAANKAKVEANAKKVAANAAKYKKSKVGGSVKSKKK